MSLLQTAFSNRMIIGLGWEQPRCRNEEGLGATGRELDVQRGPHLELLFRLSQLLSAVFS